MSMMRFTVCVPVAGDGRLLPVEPLAVAEDRGTRFVVRLDDDFFLRDGARWGMLCLSVTCLCWRLRPQIFLKYL
jgi:hypothetical protein